MISAILPYPANNINFMYKPTALFVTIVLITCILTTNCFSIALKLPAKMRVDSSSIRVAKFNTAALNKFKADKDFNYNGSSIGIQSLWDRFWSWLWNGIAAWFDRIPYGSSIVKYLLSGLSVSLLMYIVLKSLGIDTVKLWRGESEKTSLNYNESQEDIHDIDFDTEIENAVSRHDFRLAVRLLYLKCLKQLSDTHIIQWQIDKTNADYINEIRDRAQKQTFETLTRQFEYVWYGDFSIDKQAFNNIYQLFQNFKT